MKLIRAFITIWRDIYSDEQRWGQIVSTGAITTIKIIGILLNFFSSIILARTLGTSDYGVYVYVLSIITVLSFTTALGLPQYLVREGSGRIEILNDLLLWADRKAFAAGTLTILIIIVTSFLLKENERRVLFIISSFIPLLVALSEIRRALLQANGYFLRSQFSSQIIAPLSIFIGIITLWLLNEAINIMNAIIITSISALISYLINSIQLRSVVKSSKQFNSQIHSEVNMREAIRFMWLGSLYLLLSRTDLIMLGLLSSDSNTGIYGVASRIADLTTIILTASNIVLAPKIAKLYRDCEFSELKSIVKKTTNIVIYTSLPVILILFFFASWILDFFYGKEYSDGAIILRLLVISNFIIVLGGPLGTILEMTGNEKFCFKTMILVVITNIILNILLIPNYGAHGAAAATCLSVATGRIILCYKVKKTISTAIKYGAHKI